MTGERLIRGVGRQDGSGGSGPVRAMVRRLRRKLGDHTENPAYIVTESRAGYHMAKGETTGPETGP